MNQTPNETKRTDWPRAWCYTCQSLQGIEALDEELTALVPDPPLTRWRFRLGCGHDREGVLAPLHIEKIRQHAKSLSSN